MLRYPLASPDRQHYEDESKNGDFQHLARTNAPQINSHQQRNRDCHRNRERAPRTGFQRIDYDQGRHRQKNDQNGHDCRVGHKPSDAANLCLGHLGE